MIVPLIGVITLSWKADTRMVRIGLRHFLFNIKAAETDRCSCDEGSQTPKHILKQCPGYIIPRIKLREQLWAVVIKEMDDNKIISNPQTTRYVVKIMRQTGLLQQFQQVDIEEDDDEEPIGLAAIELGLEHDGYQPVTIDKAVKRETQQ